MGNARLNARSVVMPDAYGNIPATQRYSPLTSSIDSKKLKASIDAAAAPLAPVQTGPSIATQSSAPKKELIEEKPDYDTGQPNLNPLEVKNAASQFSGQALQAGKLTADAIKAAKLANTTANVAKAADAAKNVGTLGVKGAEIGGVMAKGTQAASAASKAAAVGAITSLGLGVAGTGLGLAGQAWENKALKNRDLKGYGASQVMEWGGKGLSAGSTIGGFFGAPGALIGGAIGAGVGAIGGGITGLIKKKKMLNERDETDKLVAEGNALTEKNYKRDMGQWRDRQSSQALQMASAQYKNGGALTNKRKLKDTPIFALGGTMQQEFTPIESLPKEVMQELQTNLQKVKTQEDFLATAQHYNINPEELIAYIQAVQQQQKGRAPAPAPIYKRGGSVTKLKKKSGCACEHKPMMFRRGGSLDLEKANVIIDGPSHGEYNNTGVKGDKGLPIVKNGHKIAEIESGELIINKKATEKIQDLRKAIHKGDAKAKEKLGKLLQEEIGKNTYDYTTLLD